MANSAYKRGDVITDFNILTFGSILHDGNGHLYLFIDEIDLKRIYTSHIASRMKRDAKQFYYLCNGAELFKEVRKRLEDE